MIGSVTKITPSMYDGVYVRKRQDNFLNRLDLESIDPEVGKLNSAGFLSKVDPKNYQKTLLKYCPPSLMKGGTLLDLGCGFGLLSVWLARQLNLDLIGIDFSPVAIETATAESQKLERHERSRVSFKVADFQATGLANECASAAFSHDAFYLTPNPIAALAEVHRVLTPGGPFLFTIYARLARVAWRSHLPNRNWLDLLKNTDFDTVHYKNVSVRWRSEMRRKHERRWIQRKRVENELGGQGKAELAVSEAMLGLNGKPSFLESVSRYEVLAVRR